MWNKWKSIDRQTTNNKIQCHQMQTRHQTHPSPNNKSKDRISLRCTLALTPFNATQCQTCNKTPMLCTSPTHAHMSQTQSSVHWITLTLANKHKHNHNQSETSFLHQVGGILHIRWLRFFVLIFILIDACPHGGYLVIQKLCGFPFCLHVFLVLGVVLPDVIQRHIELDG